MLPSMWENLSRSSTKLIHSCKKYHLRWITGKANIPIKYIIYIFSNSGRGSCGSSPMLFPKPAGFCCQKILT